MSKRYVVQNLVTSGSVVIEADIKEIMAMVMQLVECNNKYDLSQKEFFLLDSDKRKNKTKLKNFSHYILPERIKINETKYLNTRNIDWRYFHKLSVEEVSDQVIFPDSTLEGIKDLNKESNVFVINDNILVSTQKPLNIEKVKQNIFETLKKYVLDEELYDDRVDAWKKSYVDAENKGEVALKAFNEKNPRPTSGDEVVENLSQVGKNNTPLKLGKIFDLSPPQHFFNPYFMFPPSRNFFKGLSIKNNNASNNESMMNIDPPYNPHVEESSFFKDMKKIEHEYLRKLLKKENLKVISFKEHMEDKVQKLKQRWEQNLEDIPQNKVA